MTQEVPQLELKRFAIDNAIVLIRIVFSIVIAFGVTVILARGLGSEGKGIYELTIYLPNLINVIFSFGLPMSISYHIARGNFSVEAAIVGNSFLNFVISIMGIVSGVAIILWKGTAWFSSVPTPLLYGSLILIPMMISIRNSMALFRGIQDFRTMGLIEILQPTVSLVLYMIIILLVDLNVTQAFIATIIGYAIATLIVMFVLMRHMRAKYTLHGLLNVSYLRSIFVYGLQIYGSVIVGNLLLRVDVLLVNTLGHGATSVGLYSIAVALVERIWTLTGFTSTVLMPRVASWKDDKDRQAQLTLLTIKYSLWFSVLVALAIIVFGKSFIKFVYGTEFQQSFYAVLALLPGIIFYNFVFPIGAIIMGSGHAMRPFRYLSIAFVVNIVLNLMLIPRYDFIGAGIASSIAYTLYGSMMLWDFQHHYDIKLGTLFLITEDDKRRFHSLLKLVRQFNFRKVKL